MTPIWYQTTKQIMEEDILNYSPTVYSLNYDMPFMLLSIYTMLVQCPCLFFLYPINVKTAAPIGPKFLVGPHVSLGKVYG